VLLAPPIAGVALIATKVQSTARPMRSDLYLVSPASGKATLLLRDAADAKSTRDGATIAYVRGSAIWIARRDGTQAHRVTSPPRGARDKDPTWTPNGKMLYFARRSGSGEATTESVYAVERDARRLRVVVRASAVSGFHHLPDCLERPSVSADGRTLALTRIGSCGHTPDWSVAMDTSHGHAVHFDPPWPAWAIDPDVQLVGAQWATRASQVAFGVFDTEELRAGISIADARGKDAHSVVSWRFPWPVYPTRLAPAWSPNDAKIAFVKSTHSRAGIDVGDLWLVRADGRSLRRVTRTADYSDVAWLPAARRGR
jgi:Tol biopolymer transport system component